MSDVKLPIFQRTLDQAIAEAVEIVQEAKAEHKPSRTFLLYSGGNDSQVLLHSMWRHADEIVHIDTGIGIPEVADFCRKVAGGFAIPYTELHPPIGYENLVLNVFSGMPGPGYHRWTYTRLKERPIRQLIRHHRRYNGERFMLLGGVRRAESARRANREIVHRQGGTVWVQPLIDWTNDEMREYRQRFDVVQSEVAANLHMSGECLCGAMADQDESRSERAAIKFFYPDFDARLTALEQECERRGLKYCEWGVKRGAEPEGQFTPACQSCAWRQEQMTLTEEAQ